MNKQQAINLLKNLEQSLDDYCELNDEGKTAFRMAIKALNCSEIPNSSDAISRQAEQSACEYCREDLEGYVKPIEKNGHAFVRFGVDGWELSLSAKGWHGGTKIRFCPMCGRKLRGEQE